MFDAVDNQRCHYRDYLFLNKLKPLQWTCIAIYVCDAKILWKPVLFAAEYKGGFFNNFDVHRRFSQYTINGKVFIKDGVVKSFKGSKSANK